MGYRSISFFIQGGRLHEETLDMLYFLRIFLAHERLRGCLQSDRSHLLGLFAIFRLVLRRLWAIAYGRLKAKQNLIKNPSKSA
jgi:hypothetical protein